MCVCVVDVVCVCMFTCVCVVDVGGACVCVCGAEGRVGGQDGGPLGYALDLGLPSWP